MSANLTIEEYSDKAIALRGNSKEYKDAIKDIGGKFNSNLRGSAGWIFPKSKRSVVEDLISQISNGNVEPKEEKRSVQPASASRSNVSSTSYKGASEGINTRDFVSKKDYLDLLTRIEKLEAIASQTNFVSADAFTTSTKGGNAEIIFENENTEEQEEKSLPTSLLKSRKIKNAKIK
jgi:hypothetical protein